MKTVGVRDLKNKLSKYLSLVKDGETVLVTDHGEVIAEIRQPSPWILPGSGSDWSVIQRLAALGKITPAMHRGKPRSPSPAKLPSTASAQQLLDEVKGDR